MRLLLLFIAGVTSCSDVSDNPSLLARIGDVQITASDLRAFEARLKGNAAERVGHRDHLQTLIDREVLLVEARALNLAEDEKVRHQLELGENKKMAKAMLHSQAMERAVVADEEVERAHAQAGWDVQVVVMEIFVPDAEQVRQVTDLLQQGTDFAEAGRLHAVDPFLRVPTGAPTQSIYSPFDRPRALVEAVFALPPGGVSQAVPLHGGFVIANVVERRKAELAAVADAIRKKLVSDKKKQLRQDYLQHLRDDLATGYDPQGMDLVVSVLRGTVSWDSVNEEQRRLPVYTFVGAEMGVDEVLEAMRPTQDKWPQASPEAVNEKMLETHLPNTLIVLDARRKGVDQTADFQRWRRAEKEDLMLMRLRQEILSAAVEVGEEDLQKFYEENKINFRVAASARIQEVLVGGPDQARELRGQIEEGADMGLLARAHGQRKKAKDGIWDLSASQAPLYGEAWMKAVMNAPLNQVLGPIETRGGYSLFKVLEMYPETFASLEVDKVRRSVARDVRWKKESAHFNRYLEELRQKYADRVEVFEENLQRLEESEAELAVQT